MKTILILGDSWGQPHYYPNLCYSDHSDTHTEHRLRRLGYKVYNCARSGGSNHETIYRARSYLSGDPILLEPEFTGPNYEQVTEPTCIDIINPKIDWVVWFHTEFCRSSEHYIPTNSLDEANIKSAHVTYDYAAAFFKTLPDTKIAVIGGQCPLLSDVLLNYFTPDYMIEDWRSELIGVELPRLYTLIGPQLTDNNVDTIDFKLATLEKHKIIFDAMANSDYFPDNVHPGGDAHKILTEKLHEVFSTK